MQKAIYHLIMCAVATIVMLFGSASMQASLVDNSVLEKADSVYDRRRQEMGDITMRMVQSAYPVQINIVGNAVCVKSNYNQILPVYTETGSFYAAFRLNKGTNWLSGLPRGTYYINNRKVVIP